MRRAEAKPGSEAGSTALENWRVALLQVAAPITIIIATAFALGYALEQAWLVSGIGVLICFIILGATLKRSQYHELGWG